MTRRMLINAHDPEEVRIAIVSDAKLENFQVEVSEKNLARGNIYRGIVTNVQQSLNAAFVDFGQEKHGFLSVGEIVPEAYHRKGKGHPRIQDVIERGRPILVQVSKDPEGQKGAALTTNISLAGRYLVLTPFDSTRGVSRKVEDDDVRRQLRDQVEKLNIPEGAGFIVRTNALEQTKTTLSRDFNALVRMWKTIDSDAREGGGPKLLHSDQDVIIQTLRDYLDGEITEVLIDDDAAFDKARDYMKAFMPRGKVKVTRYTERVPLFARFGIEAQIDRIYDRTVNLPSGGSIVIDRTEALVAVDVNSGRSTRGSSQEDTALHTNLEAAAEVTRQLRLRDIGGLIVVDFIDMRSSKARASVEKAVRDGMKSDKARSTVGKLSSNGLMEINRQRIHQALHLRTQRPCPTCSGSGRIASPELVSLSLLRRIQEKASTASLSQVRISLHPELADAFQNSRRQQIAALEAEFDIHIEIIASAKLHRPEQEIEWFEREPGTQAQPRIEAPRATAPARPVAPVVHQEEETADGKRKRRRRGKKKNGAHAEESFLPPSPDFQLQSVDETEEAPASEDDLWEAEEESTEPLMAGGSTEAGVAADGKRKRRRGRRRKRGGAAGEAATVSPDVATAEDAPVAAAPAPVEDNTAAVSDAAPQQEGRKRRRRKRRRGGASAQQTGDPLLSETLPAGDDEEEEAFPEELSEPREVTAAPAPRAQNPSRRASRGPIVWQFGEDEMALVAAAGTTDDEPAADRDDEAVLTSSAESEDADAADDGDLTTASMISVDEEESADTADDVAEVAEVAAEEPASAGAKKRKPSRPRKPKAAAKPRAPRKPKAPPEPGV